MMTDISLIVGGEAGQGIQTVGRLVAETGRKAGLHVFAINDFESRIRGGHSFIQIRISDRPVRAPYHRIHLLVCLDKNTFEIHRDKLDADGMILAQSDLEISDRNVLSVDFNKMAETAGSKATANTVAAGACLALLGAPDDLLTAAVNGHFQSMSQELVGKNKKAVRSGAQSVRDQSFKWSFTWAADEDSLGLIDGARAFALGALAGDCRFAGYYPMSPATDILADLSELAGHFPLVVEQAEDEIAAVNMCIGAAFAGVRSMTATSGGGFCLMTEGLGLAGITETPLVIINAQRPGPATGLPTRTGQGDLLFVINAAQDEFPRFVLAPCGPEDAYETTARALALAEQFQVPVIILADHFLITSIFTLNERLSAPESIDRFLTTDDEMEDPRDYRRYTYSQSGVSPRALPCQGEALVLVSGNEHRPDGHLTETIADRNMMVNKRMNKIKKMKEAIREPRTYRPEAPHLLVGWGSTREIIKESVDMLRAEDMDVGAVHLCDIWPFPAEAVKKRLADKSFYMVEQNATAQCGDLIRARTGLAYTDTILQFDGRPLLPDRIKNRFMEISKG